MSMICHRSVGTHGISIPRPCEGGASSRSRNGCRLVSWAACPTRSDSHLSGLLNLVVLAQQLQGAVVLLLVLAAQVLQHLLV
eukprot:scaffold274_cov384-Prasinococcus_capsulatus_cf.AAC.2